LICLGSIERHAIEFSIECYPGLYSGGKILMCINFRLEEAFS
jgi:hypothetical protein